MNPGMVYATLAFLCWGLFPLYFHALGAVPPLEILAHRMLWSLIFLAAVLGVRRQWAWLGRLARQPRVAAGFIASAALLSLNWLIYIWAVNRGHVIDASLGYFITPLFNVVLGFALLRERLRPLQWLAVALAAAGVLWLAWQGGRMPWIALALAASFGGYGLMRKTAALGALEGLSFETLVLFPLAGGYLAWLAWHGQNTFVNAGAGTTRWLLAASGPITAIPLLLFASGARRLPLSLLGLLQYIAPSIQLLLGVVFFHESFGTARAAGFIIIWSALTLYAADGLRASRRTAADR
jgi:chloramphenicol-sensitive protein RarD